MPVRIVMRGLIGMIVNQDVENPEHGTITACLIDGARALDHAVDASLKRHKGKPEPHPHFEECMQMHKGHHKHRGEMQVFDGDKKRDGAGLIALHAGQNVDIRVDDENTNYVGSSASYDKFMPKLGRIADNAKLEWSGKLNPTFIGHTVTINRGVVRVRDVGDWDAGSMTIPSKFRKPQDTDAVYQPAKVRFLKANVYGYVATECVVDITDANRVTVAGPHGIEGTYKGHKEATLRAAEDTVEILITNYAPQQSTALPWTLHYRWMFEAAGYGTPIKLGGSELHELAKFGKSYDKESWICESEMFLGSDNETGYPFPYRSPDMWRVPLGDLDYSAEIPELQPADPWDPVRCPMGDLTPGK
ncbi:MAG TPA: hypothetical protein VI259_27905 [Gemmatimonadaceae bacterium]